MKTILALCLITTTAFARLGETQSEIETRYGAKVDQTNIWTIPINIYRFDNFLIGVGLVKGKSAVEILITKSGKHLNPTEAKALIEAISGASEWEKLPAIQPFADQWLTQSAFARHERTLGPEPETLTITTKETAFILSKQSEADSRKIADRFGPDPSEKAQRAIEREKSQREAIGAAVIRDIQSERAERETAAARKQESAAKLLKFQQELAQKGDAYGQHSMGLRYLAGDGVPCDLAHGKILLEKAAAQGYAEARTALTNLASKPK